MFKGLLTKDELGFDSDSELSEEEVEKGVSLKRKCEEDCGKIADKVLEASISELNETNQYEGNSEKCSGSSVTFEKEKYVKPSKCLKILNDDELISGKEKIESSINEAIRKGDVEKADSLNDQLMQMELALQRKQMDDAKNLRAKRNKELQEKIRKKRKKLKWTFEPKHRWETKSNM